MGSLDVLGKVNAPAATTATDPGKPSLPQGPSDKEVSSQSELEKKVDASVSSFVEGQNSTDDTEEPLDDIKKDIVASLKELENSEDADPVLLSAADTAASLIAANLPEVDQNSDGAAAASQSNPVASAGVKEGPIQAATVLPDGSTKSHQAKKDSNDTPAATSDKPNESAEANKTQSDAAKTAQGKPISLEEVDVSSGKPTDPSANPATPNEISKDTNPAPLHNAAKENIGTGPRNAANKETANTGNSDANTREDGPAGLGPKAQKPPVPKILIEAASDATDEDLPLDIPPIQTVPRAVPSVSAIPSEVIPEIAENVDEPETPKLRKRKLYLRKMRNITLQKPILDAALGRQLASETKRKLKLLAKGEPYGLNSEVPDVADPVDAAQGATEPGDLAKVDANAADPTPSATDATDSPKVAADPVDAAPGAIDPADSAEVDANAADPIPSATDATNSPKVVADPVDTAPGATDPADSTEVDANAADPAQIAAADTTDSPNVAADPVDATLGTTDHADLAEVDANAANPVPGAANPPDSSNVSVDPVDAASSAIGPADSAEVDANAAGPAPSAAADATDSSNVAVGPINSAPDDSDTTGSDAINADAADPASGAVGAPSLPGVAADTADPAPAAADTSNSIQVPETTDSAPTAANTSSSIQSSKN